MAVLLSMRLLPFAAYAVLTSAVLLRRVSVVAAYLMLPVLACSFGAAPAILFIVGGSIYYLLISLGVNRLSGLIAAGSLTRGAALMVIFFAYVLLPGVALPGIAMHTFLVLGCELALSCYSYCVETSRQGATTASLSDCLFFLFVNPTIAYRVRGSEVATPGGFTGLWRAAAGGAVMFLNAAALRPFAVYVRDGRAFAWLPASASVTLLLYGVLRFSTVYAAHSGLASIHVGLMRQIGWAVPERYRYPFLATSPMDFWRRWNTYVRVWLEAYVFFPLARNIARTKTRHRAGQAAAAVATLLASGLIHDAFVFAGRQRLADLKTETQFFLAAGLLLAAWRLVAILSKIIRARLDPNQTRTGQFELLSRLSARLSIIGAVIAAALRWG
jgi:hypothetical protein